MKYPMLRYGNPAEFEYYMQFITVAEMARRLRRTEKCIQNWLQQKEKLPWWVPEIIRLQNMEYEHRLRQMGIPATRKVLGLSHSSATIYTSPNKPKQAHIGDEQPIEHQATG